MNVIRLRDPSALRTLQVVMIVLALATLAGCALLLSASETQIPVDGAIPWSEQSPLRALVQLLCLNYAFPTIHAGDVKGYILGLGTALSVLSLALAIAIRPRSEDDLAIGEESNALAASAAPVESTVQNAKVHIQPLFAAQFAFAAYLIWSYFSAAWSKAPELAVGASILLTIQFLWALCVGFGLGPTAARIVTRGVMAISVLTAIAAIWYYYGRNPVLRAKFPSGNPTFLAASLLPGILLLVAFVGEQVMRIRSASAGQAIAKMLAAILGLGVVAWAFMLSDSRGAMLGLGFGLIAIMFFAARGAIRWVPVALAIALAIFGSAYYTRMTDDSAPGGRSETLRCRVYAWNYALRMFDEQPVWGHGQGGFVLEGDAKAVEDVENDPKVLDARIANAHNEWFQVMADLGSIGLVLVASGIVLTFAAGKKALDSGLPPSERAALLGALGALAALCVSEFFGVGLRVADVPPFFFTTLGLIWALALYRAPSPVQWLARKPGRRMIVGVVGGVAALAIALLSQQDFAAARNAYDVDEYLEKGDYDEAIRLAERSTSNLNPDRALANRLRLARAHMRAASKIQQQAIDREARGKSGDAPDRRLLALAAEDYAACDLHTKEGLRALNELYRRSPNYFNYGRVSYGLNVILAREAAVHGDATQRDQYLKAAAGALDRELQRQPFDSSLAAEYVRTAAGSLDLPRVLQILARPLRYDRVISTYLDLLHRLATDPEFETHFGPLLKSAEERCKNWGTPVPEGEPKEIWAPEVLRLAAALRITVGDFAEAARLLEISTGAYRLMADRAPLAAASAFAELADAQFFLEPTNPARAIAEANQAIKFAPSSLEGRNLIDVIKQRLIDYQLAAGDETEARKVLRDRAVAKVTDQAVDREMGTRYARLCYSLLQRPAAGVLPKPAPELRPIMVKWVERSRELNPDEYLAHYLAADFAFQDGDDAGMVEHLRAALSAGLNVEAAKQFIEVARQQRPNSNALHDLEEQIKNLEANAPADKPAPTGMDQP